jgi:hypothetical protein
MIIYSIKRNRETTNLEALGSGSFQEVVQSALDINIPSAHNIEFNINREGIATYSDNHPVALDAHLESTNRPPMLTLDIAQLHDILLDRNQPLAPIPLLKQRNDLLRRHRRLQGHRRRRHDAAEPRRDRGDERDLQRRAVDDERREVVPRLALVDVARQRVRADEGAEALGRYFGLGDGLSGGVVLHDGARAAVAGHGEDGGEGAGLDVVHERREEQLRGGGVAAWVGDALGGADGRTTIELCRRSRQSFFGFVSRSFRIRVESR